MSAYKHLKNDGSGYLVKQYPSLQQIIILAWVLIGFVLIINTSYFKTGIVIFVLSLLLVILTFRGSGLCRSLYKNNFCKTWFRAESV